MTLSFQNPAAEIFVPDHTAPESAVARCTHLGIVAHQDDLEFLAYHGILQGHLHADQWFGGVVCTDGAGSSRTGPYADFTDEQMKAIRRREQNAAAIIGGYGAMIQLAHPSGAIKVAGSNPLVTDLAGILARTKPRILYTHNPADKHDTHLAVLAAVITAIRSLPRESRPERVLGCEGWRDLDWLDDSEKVALDVSGHPNLAAALNGVFDSQIAGGKRYDLAVPGRRLANATFHHSHASDQAEMVTLAMDLTPLVHDDELGVAEFVLRFVDRFRDDVRGKLERYL